MIDNKLWKATVRCGTCKKIVNTAEKVPTKDKSKINMSAPFHSVCKNCSGNTFNDLNLNYSMQWEEIK